MYDPETDMTIQDTPRGYDVYCEGAIIARDCADWDEAWDEMLAWMNRNHYYPDVYHVNDHGNVDLLDGDGNVVEGWV